MTQPEALRLADMLENNYPLEPEAEEAAAELRRLHEENEQLRQALSQPKQEPVAWGMQRKDGVIIDVICPEEHAKEPGDYTIPLYTAPPKREWVGLTDEERVSFFTKSQDKFWDWDDGVDIEAFIRAIEAKLKEKNGA